MCSLDRYGNCTHWYCSCPERVYGIHLQKRWLSYELEIRPWWNRVIGWFINLIRKPSFYPKDLSPRQVDTTTFMRPYRIKQLNSMMSKEDVQLSIEELILWKQKRVEKLRIRRQEMDEMRRRYGLLENDNEDTNSPKTNPLTDY